jgi:PTS system nitrogen regulatory IIA component
MNIGDVLREACVVADLTGETKEVVLTELVSALKQEGLIQDAGEGVRVILEREKLGSTGIGEGVAIPHGKMKGLDTILCAFGRSKKGVEFGAVDSQPVHILFLLLAPEETTGLHLKMLSRISRDIVEEDKKFSG